MSAKLAGFVMVFLSGLLIGDLWARRHRARYRDLCSLRHALTLLETYVSRTSQPIPRALESVGRSTRGPAGLLFCRISEVLTDNPNLTLSQGWDLVQAEMGGPEYPAYSADDLEILQRLFGVLGGSGRGDQVTHIRLARDALAINEGAARRDLDIYPKLFRYLGALGASVIALAIL